jgi:prepilin-type N-terminal cleavage/methylation domain-containing protein
MRAKQSQARARRGVTLIELLLAIAITAMIALGVASMMTAVSTVAETDREARSALLRSLAVREALRAYVEESLCVLQISDDELAIAVWLEDDLGPGLVNISELRVIRFDPATDAVVAERVVFPAGQHPVVRQSFDYIVTDGMDPIAMIQTFSGMSLTAKTTLASGVSAARWSLSDATERSAVRARLWFELLAPAAASADPADVPKTPMLVAFGLPEHRSPDR